VGRERGGHTGGRSNTLRGRDGAVRWVKGGGGHGGGGEGKKKYWSSAMTRGNPRAGGSGRVFGSADKGVLRNWGTSARP